MLSNQDEKEIKELLEPLRSEKISDGDLAVFETEVMRRVKPAFPVIGIAFSAAAVCALAAVLGLVWMLRPQPAPVLEPALMTAEQKTVSDAPAFPPLEAARERVPFEKTESETPQALPAASSSSAADADKDAAYSNQALSDEIILLELLGEDEGLFNDLDRLAMDMRIIESLSPAGPAFAA